jgi:hypothetical protein
MRELLKSIVAGIFFGLLIYFFLSLLSASDAGFFGIAAAFSITGARMFSPARNIMLGLKSLFLVDWVAAVTLAFIMFFAAEGEAIAIRAIRFACYGAFFLAVAISIRCPIYLFKKRVEKNTDSTSHTDQ